jgi:cysteinyl-tRNA synthetase
LQENRIGAREADQLLDILRQIDTVLGIFRFTDAVADPDIRDLIQQREQARRRRDWERADAIRDQLESRGVHLKDRKLDPA